MTSFINNESKAKKYVRTVIGIVRKQKLDSKINEVLFDALASSYKAFLDADDEIVKDGLFIENRFGDKITHPAHKASIDSKTNITRILETLGVTAKLRGKLTLSTEEKSPFEDFLNNGK